MDPSGLRSGHSAWGVSVHTHAREPQLGTEGPRAREERALQSHSALGPSAETLNKRQPTNAN